MLVLHDKWQFEVGFTLNSVNHSWEYLCFASSQQKLPPRLWWILDDKCDLWGQNQANIIRDSEIVCNAAVTASVQRAVFSDLLWAAVAVQFLIT